MPFPANLLAVAALLAFGATDAPTELSYKMPVGFDASLFPESEKLKTARVDMAGLSVIYPGRVLSDKPLAGDPNNAGRTPFMVDLPSNITYARIYDLKASLEKAPDSKAMDLSDVLSRPNVILDLRYVYADAETAQAFAQVLANAGLVGTPLMAHGEFAATTYQDKPLTKLKTPVPGLKLPPIVVAIVNGQTAGPLEAWLAAFQETQNVPVVGTSTAGQPGSYALTQDAPDYYVITGELVPSGGSLAGKGIAPRFPVEVTPKEDYDAYRELEENTKDPAALLRHAISNPPSSIQAQGAPSNNNASGTETKPVDPVLQRAVDVVAALQLLGHSPALSTAPAGGASTAKPMETPATAKP